MSSKILLFLVLAKVVLQNFCHSSLPPLKTSLAHLHVLLPLKLTFSHQPLLLIPILMTPIKFSTHKVRKVLLQLNTSKSSGPDGIPAIVLKSCAPELTTVLNKHFQLSYNLDIFSSSWKYAHIFPIPQKGDKAGPLNCCPIAITSLISKTMETIITK